MSAPRTVITSHNPDGTSKIASDAAAKALPMGSSSTGSSFSCFHIAEKVPVNAVEPLPSDNDSVVIPRAPPTGLMFGSVDFQPGTSTPMHRTMSVDYGTILEGEITLILDGGEETVLKAGDVYVQRGTSHSWVNRGTSICRMTFVAVSRDEIVVGGASLD